MKKYVSCCPVCGEQSLEVECDVIVLFSVSDDGTGGQDWRREEVFNESSKPHLVRCAACSTEWTFDEFDFGGGGITSLEPKGERRAGMVQQRDQHD